MELADGTEKKTKSYISNTKRQKEQGIILDVWQKTVIEALMELEEDHDLTDKDEGHLIKLIKKGNKYTVSLSKSKPLMNTSLLKKAYPDFDKLVEKQTFDYESQKLKLLETKLAKQLAKQGLVDLADPLGKDKDYEDEQDMEELEEEDEDELDEDESEDDDWDEDDDYEEDEDDL